MKEDLCLKGHFLDHNRNGDSFMKRRTIVLFAILGLFLVTGCFGKFTPSERVEDMFNRYIKNDEKIMKELEEYMGEQELSTEQKRKYSDIIKNEYATIKYNIKDEKIDGDEAQVEVAIEVKDLFKASKEAGEYLVEHAPEFYTNGVYDRDKFIDYKLDVMKDYSERVNYTIYIDLIKKDGLWTIEQIDNESLEKIHGIYDYEVNKEI